MIDPRFFRKYLDILDEQSKFPAGASELPQSPIQEWSGMQSGSWTDNDMRDYTGNDPRINDLRDAYLKKYPTPPDPEIYPELYSTPPEADPPRRSGSWTDAEFRSYSGNDPRAIELRDLYLKKHPTPPDPKLYPELYGEPPQTPTSSNVAPSSGYTSSNVAPSSGYTSSNVVKSSGSRTSSKVDNTANTPREPYAAPVDFNTRSATQDIADTGLGKLSGGVSLGGGAGNYLSPQLRAELANQSGGKFYGDIGQSGSQFGYEQKFGDKARGQLAVRQTPGGGQSVGIGGSYDVTPNLKLTGGVSRDIKGQGGDRADIGLRYDFKESMRKYLDILDEQVSTLNIDNNTSITADPTAKTISAQTKVGNNLNLKAAQDLKAHAGTMSADLQVDPNLNVGAKHTQAGYKGQMTPTTQMTANYNNPEVGKVDLQLDKGAMFQGAGKNVQQGNPAITTAKFTNPQGQTATYNTNRNL